jgi:D-alanyl-D-alanine carboxypeptidase
MKAYLFILSLFVSISLQAELIDHEKVSKALQELRYSYQFPALSMAISAPEFKEPQTYVVGTLKKQGNVAISATTPMQVGGICQAMIATVILQLEKEGLLKQEDTLAQWFPEYPAWADVTIQQLLYQKSGIVNYMDVSFLRRMEANPMKEWTAKELVDSAYTQRKNTYFPAGKSYKFSNTNYILLGMIAEEVTQETFQSLITNRILKPLKMNHSWYQPNKIPPKLTHLVAHGYGADSDPKSPLYIFNNQDVTESSLSWARETGALWSTPSDICLWVNGLFSETLLDNEQMTLLTAPHTTRHITLDGKSYQAGDLVTDIQPGTIYSSMGILSFMSVQKPYYGHVFFFSGQMIGYTSVWMYYPQWQVCIAISGNLSDSVLNNFIPFIERKILPLITTEAESYTPRNPMIDAKIILREKND